MTEVCSPGSRELERSSTDALNDSTASIDSGDEGPQVFIAGKRRGGGRVKSRRLSQKRKALQINFSPSGSEEKADPKKPLLESPLAKAAAIVSSTGDKHHFTNRSKGRQKNFFKRPKPLHPKMFLLGGNMRDPLNLEGLMEKGSRGSTPVPSPGQTPVRQQLPTEMFVPLPRLISKDPLHLESQKHNRRHKRRRRDSLKSGDAPNVEPTEKKPRRSNPLYTESLSDTEVTVMQSPPFEAPKQIPLNVPARGRDDGAIRSASPVSPSTPPQKRPRLGSNAQRLGGSRHSYDPIVSPVPQSLRPPSIPPKSASPVKPRRDTGRDSATREDSGAEEAKKGKPKKDAARFRYGNYNQYYGKRLPADGEDPRLGFFKPEWFQKKSVLDIGCNIGHLTILLARDFRPRSVLGVDIDGKLISIARKNVRHYLDRREEANKVREESEFPLNLVFRAENFVLESEAELDEVRPQYDTILALSVSKWVHLNWGDEGMKRFFKRVHRSLRPGGRFLFEPQPWEGYNKRKKISPEIRKNYTEIRLKPEHFQSYLLGAEIGFKSCEQIGIPPVKAKGFQRPIQLYTKSYITAETQKEEKK